MTAKQPLLAINHIDKQFGETRILSDVSLTMNKGQLYGLIGLNGTGKTTLIKIILGLLEQNSGETLLLNHSSHSIKNKYNIAYIPEKFQPSPFLKGREFLALSLSYYDKPYDHKKAVSLAKKLELAPEALDRRISGYSKGMGQKLGLISAFLINTPLLILDEPMSGLDPSARIRLKDMLLEHAKKGQSIFFSSHILSDIDEICDRIGVIHKQNVIFEGSPSTFRKKYKSSNLERSFLKAVSAV